MDSNVYWIWLQSAIGFASNKVRDVVEIFGGAEGFYKAGASEREQSKLFTSAALKRIENTKLSKAQEILDKCNKLGYNVIAYNNKQYPERLRSIQDPPAVLYVKGDIPEFDKELTVAVVGTRKASHHGYRMGLIISQRLGWAGAVIVSGCAPGIDTSAHIGCLEGYGTTVAVLGCSIDYQYNMQNHELREKIAETGALISEYPPGTAPQRYFFPQRNRIMSGLSCATVVVEGALKSGSMITAGCAIEQGRDVYVIPGNADDPNMLGVNALLRDGATPVMCALDILSNYVMDFAERLDLDGADKPLFSAVSKNYKPDRPMRKVKFEKTEDEAQQNDEISAEQMPQGLSENAAKLYKALKTGEPQHIDVLSAKAGLTASQALSAVTELELEGIIVSMPGRRFSR